MSQDFIERPRKNEKDGAIAYVQELLKQAREDRRNDDVDKLENLVRLLNTKKYGLVWEEHAELVEEEMKTKIPVFIEDETKKIVGNSDSEDYNFLLEGDNLHSLHLLKKTHSGAIDVIYIDPPYNTGNQDFIYNDKIVEKTDGFSHSKWLSFMSKRLEIARELLSKKGVIFISIDDNEQAQLKLLCDEVLGADNFVSVLPTIMNLKGNQDEFGFAGTHEYTVVYVKNKSIAEIKQFLITDESEIEEQGWSKDAKGYFKKGATLKRTGVDAPRVNRPTTYYPILIKDNEVSVITIEEYQKIYDKSTKKFDDSHVDFLISKYSAQGFDVLLPESNAEKTSWRWQYSKVRDEKSEIIITDGRDGKSLYKKQRPQTGKYPTKKAKTLFYKPEYSSGNGTKQVKEVLGKKVFNNPKPIELIKDFLLLTTSSSSTILDFFAGSGTTGHAVAQLNKEDGGNRKFILCTNNENNICEEVTYKRLANIQEDLPHNLKYFKTDFVVKEDFPDVTLEYELLNYVTPLVELEFGVDISNPKVQVILSEDQLDEMDESDFVENSTLFIHPEVFFDSKQERILRDKNITKQEIPDYYFGKDIWS
ncbi:TPA: site-specific DNA-methyltransferase [Streptococcus agalactiae]|nr:MULTISPECIES: site-specific DNA-methyltransferase [Streptococcus]MCL6311736.1 site-specific DNA-methyltransferase [Streptococcus agalactiae]MDY4510436.1 site-specific DNA-methyltransferase [Streptococcus hyovaginalis]HEN4578382.1 site-specific DNA-methyltransferase [Streptococcus agalactiae]HEN4595428.1 site-specific DNA-methyltransferase [Streptococcus agalactiae]HEN4618975.1 site-specific DNA-methyltransferase [Streptococcus agalactiae]